MLLTNSIKTYFIINMIKMYNNVATDKSLILSDSEKKATIYIWLHKLSGKIYVGSAFNLSRRLRSYYSLRHLERYKSMYINKALLKHKYSSFSLVMLEYIDITDLSLEEARKLILGAVLFRFS